jgi:hypothetical protein
VQHVQNLAHLRRYCCEAKNCGAFGQAFSDRAKIAKALAPGGKGREFCPDCGKPIFLRDVLEEKFEPPAVKEKVGEMQNEGQAVIDNEIRTVDGEIRWMDVSTYLKCEGAGGKAVRQIVFEGERFDAVSVQNWRKKVLAGG